MRVDALGDGLVAIVVPLADELHDPEQLALAEEGNWIDALAPGGLGRRGDRLAEPDLGERLPLVVDDPIALGLQPSAISGATDDGGACLSASTLYLLGEDATGANASSDGPDGAIASDLGLGDIGHRGRSRARRPRIAALADAAIPGNHRPSNAGVKSRSPGSLRRRSLGLGCCSRPAGSKGEVADEAAAAVGVVPAWSRGPRP